MKCPKCNVENLYESKFCVSCGSLIKLTITCRKCNTANPAKSRFCNTCGTTIFKMTELIAKRAREISQADEKKKNSWVERNLISTSQIKRLKPPLLPFVVVMTLIAIIVGVTFVRSEEEPIINANLRTMISEYKEHEPRTKDKFLGKLVQFSGGIVDLDADSIDLVPLGSDMFQVSGAECKFKREERSKILLKNKNQTVTVVGRVKDIRRSFEPVKYKLEDCRFPNNSAD